MTVYWEPRQFAVGDRVRVHLSPECRFAPKTRHGPQEEGRTGTVYEGPWGGQFFDKINGLDPLWVAHSVWVRFDTPLPEPDGDVTGAAFAPIELEPLERVETMLAWTGASA